MIPFDLVIGLALELLVWLAVRLVLLIWRGIRPAVFDNPLLTLAILSGANRLGWFLLLDAKQGFGGYRWGSPRPASDETFTPFERH